MRVTAAEAARAMGAVLEGPPHLIMEGVTLDSRQVKPGDLFVALPGERVDGHQFVVQAVEAGAVAICVRRDREEVWRPLSGKFSPGRLALLVVEDTQAALQDLAAWYRGHFDLPVVAVTGSVGKTTTKDLIAAVLRQRWRVVATRGNLNNELGVPLTLLRLEPESQAAVVEMGMRGLGQIRHLCTLARPTVGVITVIGESHLELLGSREKIAEAKGELLEALPPEGLAVLNAEEPLLMGQRSRTRARVVTFGREGVVDTADFFAEKVVDQGILGTRFFLRWAGGVFPVELTIPGRHNVLNATAAVAIGLSLGLQPGEVQAGLAQVELSGMRTQVVNLPHEIRVVHDAYNASPTSVRAAVDLLLATPGEGRRLAILGDMLELGPEDKEAHYGIGAYAGRRLAMVAGYGERAAWIVEGARSAGLGREKTPLFKQAPEAVSWLKKVLLPGDILLVKGSRGMRMEEIVDLLQKEMDQK